MDSDSIKKDYFDKLGVLFENKLLDYDTFTHYKKRGVKIYDTNSDLKCTHLSKNSKTKFDHSSPSCYLL